ncbi:hypothetical protein V5O48_006295 [Marasmius crinis-equi]|uniref:CRAL-TRIO domain-containing protein n=1 Tax=Marasmius crinis-equi TaxID=585013 RepID=A0ABR3FJX6_9AGAR
MHCLPADVKDPLGRPILVIRAMDLKEPSERLSPALFHVMERLRDCLKALNDASDEPLSPFLQYVVLLDVKELSMQSMTGMWSIAKRVLPASAVSRVFFPSPRELIGYFSTASLPKGCQTGYVMLTSAWADETLVDYGGDLAPLNSLENILNPRDLKTTGNGIAYQGNSEVVPQSPNRATRGRTPTTALSPTSASNPYFGYPALFSNGSSSLHHGRKRKRDLVRTLLILLWQRWRGPISASLWAAAFALAVRLWFRRSLHSSADASLLMLRTWWSTASPF